MSREGKLVYLHGEVDQETSLSWRDRDGKEIEVVGDPQLYDLVVLSPDERFAAVGIINDQAGTWDIWVVDLVRDFATRFTNNPADDWNIVWDSDSRGLYFASDRSGEVAFYYKELGSPDEPRLVFTTGLQITLWDISADGKTIIYSEASAGTGMDLWSAELDGESEPRLLRSTAGNEGASQLSPDEKWLAFASTESGEWQIYVAPWPAMSPISQVSTTTGTWFSWTRGGKELVFQETSGKLVAVSMTEQDGRMSIGRPESLFEFSLPDGDSAHWSMTDDGERFLTVNSQLVAPPTYCNYVVNWPGILEQR
jgi:Tol biopolymer transport system component